MNKKRLIKDLSFRFYNIIALVILFYILNCIFGYKFENPFYNGALLYFVSIFFLAIFSFNTTSLYFNDFGETKKLDDESFEMGELLFKLNYPKLSTYDSLIGIIFILIRLFSAMMIGYGLLKKF